jgi:hypothetical protein
MPGPGMIGSVILVFELTLMVVSVAAAPVAKPTHVLSTTSGSPGTRVHVTQSHSLTPLRTIEGSPGPRFVHSPPSGRQTAES